jgi:cytidylate kinase
VVASLLVVTGPPGAGKSTVARLIAGAAERSVLVDGDAFFGFLAEVAIEPWLPASNEQNTVVTRAAAAAAGHFAAGGYATVFDGVVGPWFCPTFAAATTLERIDYVILLPSVETCVHRVDARVGHGFTDESATRKMHAEFAGAQIDERHVLRNPPENADDVASAVLVALERGDLSYEVT